MASIEDVKDDVLVAEISRRFEEKTASLQEMEFMTKKLLDLNEQAKEAEEVKSKFLSLIKNEFNNPISTLLSLSKNLVSKKNPEKFDAISRMINEEVLRIDFQLKNIFSASEIEAGEISSDFSTVSLETIFNDVLESFTYLIEQKNLSINFVEGKDLVFVTDSSKIYLILLNLISNACEYSFPDSAVEVRAKEGDGNIIIEVEDHGEGISLDFHKEIYNRFTRQTSGKTRSHTGLGLGLSIVRALVESLDGNIEFTSKDQITLFTVTLPKLADDVANSISSGSNDFLFDEFDDADEMVEL